MQLFKRFGFFILLNFAIVASLLLVSHLLGVGNYLGPHGIDLWRLGAFSLLWGFGGAFISLAISRWIAKKTFGVQLIEENEHNPRLREVRRVVHELSMAAGLPKMPEVGIYYSSDVNAFATGPSKSRSLVAVSSALLERMSPEEVRGVLAHEVAHISNGDMVTMTLLTGLVNSFVIFLARIISYGVSQVLRGDEEEGGGMSFAVQLMLQIVLEIVFMLFGSMVLAYYSRQREFRADQGGARLGGRGNMINALNALRRISGVPSGNSPGAMGIDGRGGMGLARLFSTHPSLELRVERLTKMV